MTSGFYLFSIVPVLSIASLLSLHALVRLKQIRVLALHTFTLVCWSILLLLVEIPSLNESIEIYLSTFTPLITATYVHTMYRLMAWNREYRRITIFGYILSGSIFVLSVWNAKFVVEIAVLQNGPWFLSPMALAGLLALFPLSTLLHTPPIEPNKRTYLSIMIAAGLLHFVGCWSSVISLSLQQRQPYSLLLILAALLLTAHVMNQQQEPHENRLLERSLIYYGLAAVLSAVFLFGVLYILSDRLRPSDNEYYISVLFLFIMAALAFEPLRQYLLDRLGQALLRHRTPVMHLARELVVQEERSDQAERLAELGTFTAAVAHEIRNPLGVITAHLKLLSRQDVSPDSIAIMQGQIERANHFIEDLLRYGRPRALELRRVHLSSLLDLAGNTTESALTEICPKVPWDKQLYDPNLMVEVDQSQLMQVFVILFENAMLAMKELEDTRILIRTERQKEQLLLFFDDSGPGITAELEELIFAPFFTTRKREKTMSTGLGLAIAKNIVERHHGTLSLVESQLGGACFCLELPFQQNIMAAAPPHEGANQCRLKRKGSTEKKESFGSEGEDG